MPVMNGIEECRRGARRGEIVQRELDHQPLALRRAGAQLDADETIARRRGQRARRHRDDGRLGSDVLLDRRTYPFTGFSAATQTHRPVRRNSGRRWLMRWTPRVSGSTRLSAIGAYDQTADDRPVLGFRCPIGKRDDAGLADVRATVGSDRRSATGMFDNRVASITGGESGIGAACAKALGDAGARSVITWFSDEAAARAVCAAIGGADRAIAVQADVGDEAAVVCLYDAAETAFGM